MAEWSRVVNTTTHQFLKGAEVNVLRNRKLLALMKDKGRITMNAGGGDLLQWQVQYKEIPLQGYADQETIVFSRQDYWKTAQLEWRGYVMANSITKRERIMNSGAQAIINMYSELVKLLVQNINAQFGQEFYIDGNASGNEKRLHGLESFMSSSGASASAPSGTPNDSYAGLNTALGSYGGTWTGSWPQGYGDSMYDFWTPLLVDYTSAVATASGGWAANTKTWPNTCIEAIRYAILFTQKNRTLEEQLDMILLETDLYRQYLDAVGAKERIQVTRGEDSALVKLGFKDVMNLDGTDITTEYGIPASTGYGINVDKMELRSGQDMLFKPTGPDFDISTQSWRFLIDMVGNLQCNPRFFCKFKNYT